MTKDEIKNRIVAEYRKYAKSDLDWAEIAAAKIYAALNQSVSQVEQIRSFRLKCRQTACFRNDVHTPINKVVNQRDYVGLETFLKHGVETFNRYNTISYNGEHRAELYEKINGKWTKLTDEQVSEILKIKPDRLENVNDPTSEYSSRN